MAEPELLLSPLVGSSSLLCSQVLIILLSMTPPFHSVVLQAWTMSILQCKHHGNSFIFSTSTMIIYSLDILSGLPKGTSAFYLSLLPTFPNQIAIVQIYCTSCNQIWPCHNSFCFLRWAFYLLLQNSWLAVLNCITMEKELEMWHF